MSRCNNCKIEILDDACVCPLCRCVITKEGGVENKYPDIYDRLERFKLAIRIYAFCAVVVQLALFYINYKTSPGYWWSIITFFGLAYAYLTMAVLIDSEHMGYRMKTFVGVAGLLCMVVHIDVVSGYLRWSFNYVMPGLVLGVAAAILVLMLMVNRRSWQSYIPVQMWLIVISLCQYVLYALGFATKHLLINISVMVSIALFLGTLIIGGQKSLSELRRRFHF